jgi:hypothetical protein
MKLLKYLLLTFLLMIFVPNLGAQSFVEKVIALQSQTIEGKWNGKIQLGAQTLTFIFEIDTTRNEVTFGVIEQGATGIPTTVEFLGPDSISVKSEMAKCTYSGYLQSGIIKGKFAQNGYQMPLDLIPGDVKFVRPPGAIGTFSFQDGGSEVSQRGGRG